MSAVIDFKSLFIEKISSFCQNPLNSDVVLVVGKDRIPAHRLILAAHSDFFQDLLFGEGRNKSGEVKIETYLPVLKVLLKFMYTGILNFRNLKFDDVLKLFELAHRFEMKKVEVEVLEFLYTKINEKNEVIMMEMCPLPSHEEVAKVCFIVEMAIEGICQLEPLPKTLLLKVLDRPSRKVSEAKLLSELLKYVGSLTMDEKQMMLAKIQFSKLTHEQLANMQIPLEIFPGKTYAEKTQEWYLHGANKRVGKYTFGPEAVVLTGDGKEFIFENGEECTSHSKGNSIVVDLGALYIVNHIKFNLQFMHIYGDSTARYHVEVSGDQKNWTRIADVRNDWCTDKQEIYFPEIALRYIKVTGVDMLVFQEKTTRQETFRINSLEMFYVENPPKSIDGFIYPNYNVAVELKAVVSCSSSNADTTLMNQKFTEKGQLTPYTAQVIEEGPLMIAFKQPYILDSCRFRLWDYDGRRYGYGVGVCTNGKTEVLTDRSKELLDGWQTITFTPRVVSRFYIWGAVCSGSAELRLAHFEAPANSTEKP